MTDTKNMPGLIAIGVALVMFVSALAAHGAGHHSVGLVLGGASAALLVVGVGWQLVAHLRVRKIEDRWYADHPDTQRQRRSS